MGVKIIRCELGEFLRRLQVFKGKDIVLDIFDRGYVVYSGSLEEARTLSKDILNKEIDFWNISSLYDKFYTLEVFIGGVVN